MLRKLSLMAVAAVSLGAAALAPTAASAHWHGGWYGGWHGYGWHRPWYGPRVFVGGPYYSYGYGGGYVRRLVPTPWGPRWRLVNRCY
ncbi:sulfur globule protein precursor [Bradyrhizobium sp. SZCCHNPS2010]|uniref:sulfur globule protein precursor n=1 Tax=Bradyrhizobium sp. SZCCHNPS2010 TaxID=3057333 RepID=UPI002916FF8D|nr:sulfur globule protein precursor [Bradyrhizobium sp. SZCCHNPS2010]